MPPKVNEQDECLLSCPAVKDHLQHALDHLTVISKSRRTSKEIRNQTLELEKIVRSAHDFIKFNAYHFHVAESLPKKKKVGN